MDNGGTRHRVLERGLWFANQSRKIQALMPNDRRPLLSGEVVKMGFVSKRMACRQLTAIYAAVLGSYWCPVPSFILGSNNDLEDPTTWLGSDSSHLLVKVPTVELCSRHFLTVVCLSGCDQSCPHRTLRSRAFAGPLSARMPSDLFEMDCTTSSLSRKRYLEILLNCPLGQSLEPHRV